MRAPPIRPDQSANGAATAPTQKAIWVYCSPSASSFDRACSALAARTALALPIVLSNRCACFSVDGDGRGAIPTCSGVVKISKRGSSLRALLLTDASGPALSGPLWNENSC
jgi:hypothetical protein